jgi:hypothetical protein
MAGSKENLVFYDSFFLIQISFRLKYLFEVLNDRELFIAMRQENQSMMSKSFHLKFDKYKANMFFIAY